MKKKNRKGRPPGRAKPAPAVNPKADRSKEFKTKIPTIQAMVSEYAEKARKMEKIMGTRALLTRFVLFLDKRGFVIVHRNDVAHVAVKYLAFESRLK